MLNFLRLLLLIGLVSCQGAYAANITDDKLNLGDPLSTNDKELIFNKGQAGSNPRLIWNEERGKIQFSNDGVGFKDIGSGSGGAGDGINAFTPDDNPNAEEGIDAWTASAGTFAASDTDPLEGEQSFTWTPNAQNDYVDSPVLDFDKDVFRGRACEARIEVKGGDENLAVQVLNGNDSVVGENAYEAQSLTAPFSVYFRCPSQAEITGDAQKGNLRLRILNEGASAAPLIKWDLTYAGTLKGLVELALPDVLSVNIENNGSISIGTSKGGIWWDSVTRDSEGMVTIDYSSLDLDSKPGFEATGAGSSNLTVEGTNESATITARTAGAGSITDSDFHFALIKHESDAKQTAQVFYNIPKVSENINEFSANISSIGTVSRENSDWIDGDCVKSGVNNQVGTCAVTGFEEIPNCNCSARIGSQDDHSCMIDPSSSSSSIVYRVTSDSTPTAESVILKCQRSDDFKLPTVQPVVLGQNVSYYEGSELESFVNGYASFGNATFGSVCSSSSCTRHGAKGIGQNMTATRGGSGFYEVSIPGFKASAGVSCTCTNFDPCTLDPSEFQADGSGVVTLNVSTSGGDGFFNIKCEGPRAQ